MTNILFFTFLLIIAFSFGFAAGYGISAPPKKRSRYSGILDEMHRSRTDSFVNNPVVKEINKDWKFK